MTWSLEPGERIRRVEVHNRHGGTRQGGIGGRSSSSPDVLIFSDPGSGEQHGYFDEWKGDVFHYAGAGQRGNQRLTGLNGAILHHKAEGRSLRVFWGTSGIVEYAGEFEVDEADPYYFTAAPETGGGPTRQVVMFRLHPLGEARVENPARPARRIVHSLLSTGYRHVDPNQGSAPRDPFTVDPDALDRGLRGHMLTQEALAELVQRQGFDALSPGSGDPPFDLAWRAGHTITIVEVKSMTGANEALQIRLGLGQVLDYKHQLELADESVEPAAPRWLSLCARHDVELVWPATFGTLFAKT
jgi:hypothetical protein